MPVSRAVSLDRFARHVARALDDAHNRGLSDREIEQLTGVGSSTFHRWRRGEFGAAGPQPEKVKAFFGGLGMSVKVAFDMLGLTDEDVLVSPSPDPDIPPEVRELLRRLRDPNLPESERTFIFETVKSLIARRLPPVGAATPRRSR